MKRHLRSLVILILLFALAAAFAFAAIKEAKERSQVPDQYKWDLSSMYKADKDWEADFVKCGKLMNEITRYQNTLGKNSKALLTALTLADELSNIKDKLYAYASLRSDEDTRNNSYQSMLSRATTIRTNVNTALAFVEPEILTIPKEKINLFLKQEKGLKLYAFYIEKVQRLKPHILSAKEEEIIASSGDMYKSIPGIYTTFNNAEMKFPKVKDEKGKEIQLSAGTFLMSRESTDKKIRREFYDAFYKTYGNYMGTFASILAAKIKGDWFYAKNANYPTVLEYSLDENNIPVSVYNNLITTVSDNLKPVYRYYALRKKLSGLKDYNVIDNYYPLVEPAESEISFEKAREILNTALSPMGKDYMNIVNLCFDEKWIDVYENTGKRTGAYSEGIYGCNPYILLNFNNNLSETLTLAHEIGHSAHTYLTNTNQPYIYSNYPIFIAEVASTFNEHLTMKYLLENTKDKKEKLYLVLTYLNEAVGTLYRQTMFAEFEKEIHTRVEKGEALTKDGLNKLYFDLCKKYYGPGVAMDDINAYEWARIPHFLRYQYYVYQYSTCFAASTALFDNVEKEGKPAVDKYLAFLKAGDSDYPINLLKKAGVDMSKPESILPAIRLFEKLLDEAEKLVNEGVK